MTALHVIVNIDVKTMEHLIFEFKHEIQSINVNTRIFCQQSTNFLCMGKSLKEINQIPIKTFSEWYM